MTMTQTATVHVFLKAFHGLTKSQRVMKPLAHFASASPSVPPANRSLILFDRR